jgi:hypothetical protein
LKSMPGMESTPESTLSLPAPKMNEVNLVNLTDETFSQSLFNGAENIGGYSIYWKGKQHIIEVEGGIPYQGIYQMLSYIVSKSKTINTDMKM